MVEGSAIRGSRIGSGPVGESERGEVAPRTEVTYWCSRGHEVRRSFADDAVVPDEWDCPNCGLPSAREGAAPPPRRHSDTYKSHLEYVKERRSEEDGQALLEEALQRLRQRREV